MATIINLNEKSRNENKENQAPVHVKKILEERKRTKREPLTPEKLRKTPGLENLSDEEATEAIDSIKKLVAILFEIACQNENTCIDNQQVVCLKEQNKAA